ncbi:MAG: efflux transporter periplasmic adaptor subunit, partial [Alphaproteobacteria bacterium PA3]
MIGSERPLKLMFRRAALSALLFSSLVLVGCGSASDAPPTAQALPTVRVAIVATSASALEIQAIGTAMWRQETPLGFTSDGQIARILVNEGDIVRRGQLLATLDTTPIVAELSVAQAEA